MSGEIRTADLRPCPFCGGNSIMMDQFGAVRFAVSCEADGCLVIGPERSTREEAAAAWNAELKR